MQTDIFRDVADLGGRVIAADEIGGVGNIIVGGVVVRFADMPFGFIVGVHGRADEFEQMTCSGVDVGGGQLRLIQHLGYDGIEVARIHMTVQHVDPFDKADLLHAFLRDVAVERHPAIDPRIFGVRLVPCLLTGLCHEHLTEVQIRFCSVD